ncbi:MAG TPA: aminoglycoside phosphotransferase family protein [Bryobacteraceae bacterium]|nr:aminoglycoside phosphotransferase family protein [Bryobacteraceae bacterium]
MFDLQADNAAEYLRTRGMACDGARITELGGGVSNTVLLVEASGRPFVLKQALGRLRVEDDWFSDRERVFRESAAISWLRPYLPTGSVPEILFEDRENCLFAMTAAPREAETWKVLLMRGEADAGVATTIGRMLARMISASWGDPEAERVFGDQTVFDQLRLDPYYRTSAGRHPDLKPQFERLMRESAGRRVSLVHGDWSPKNFLVSTGAVMAIDFEVIHFGDPSFDAAFLLNHLLLKSFYRPAWSGALGNTALAFWEACRAGIPKECGRWIEPATLRHLGCLLLARVDGKSPAEYITDPALRERVREFARQLILAPPEHIADVFDRARRCAA